MNTAFADSHYWIAVVRPNDQWADAAKKARESLGNAHLVTTDEVLTEFLAAMGSSGEKLGEQAAKIKAEPDLGSLCRGLRCAPSQARMPHPAGNQRENSRPWFQ